MSEIIKSPVKISCAVEGEGKGKKRSSKRRERGVGNARGVREIASAVDVVDSFRVSKINKVRERGALRFNVKYRDLSFISSKPEMRKRRFRPEGAV